MRKILLALALVSCAPDGQVGGEGPAGPQGPAGPPGADAAGATKDGTRIKQRYLVSSDGARIAAGLFDSDTKQVCVLAKGTDQQPRCLPSEDLTYGPATWADSMCSTRLLGTGTGAKGTMVRSRLDDGTYQVYQLTAPFQGTIVYKGLPANCVGERVDANPGTSFYFVNLIEPAMFVSLHFEP